MLNDAAQWLDAQLRQHASQNLIYQRGRLSVPLAGSTGTSTHEQTDMDGHTIRVHVTDFLISTTDLQNSPIGGRPQRGDRIWTTRPDGSLDTAHEVMSIGDAPPWRYSDPSRVRLRIHAKEIDQQ